MSFIKKKTCFVSLSILLASSASAADLADDGVHSHPSYDASETFSWTGAYAGLHGGAQYKSFNDNGAPAVGGQLGYNFQAGPGVFGAELEGSYMNNEVRVSGGRLESRFRGAAKAKAGLGLDRTLIYGAAGVTTTEFERLRRVSNKWKSGSENWTQGYLFGGGVEHAFSAGVSAKIEYNYVISNGVRTTDRRIGSKSDQSDHVVKFGLNFQF
jgi:outer membrane immunogenic protein